MKALYKSEAAPGLVMADLPEPQPGPNEVKIRVQCTGICGTDLHIEEWDAWAEQALNTPIIPGHEFSGEVVEVGAGVEKISPGMFVSGEGHITCGDCRNCRAGRRHLCRATLSVGVDRHGAFAEYVVIPEENVWHHAHPISPQVAAIFDPLGNAIHSALSFPLAGEDVLITGAGPIGLMCVAVAKHVGARYVVISDVNDKRLAIAREMGADRCVNVTDERISHAQRELGMEEGFDVGLEMSGHPSAVAEMVSNMNYGGNIAVLGLPTDEISLDWTNVVTRMLTIKGIYGREMFETWHVMTGMVNTGLDLGPVITETFPAENWQDAFDCAKSRDSGKVLIDWTTL